MSNNDTTRAQRTTAIKQAEGAARLARQIAETRAYLKNKRRGQADGLLQQLVSVCPVFRDCRPLAIGIHREICAALSPAPSLRTVRGALRLHTRSEGYLRTLAAAGSVRFHMDGSVAGEVSDEDRERASGHAVEVRPVSTLSARGTAVGHYVELNIMAVM